MEKSCNQPRGTRLTYRSTQREGGDSIYWSSRHTQPHACYVCFRTEHFDSRFYAGLVDADHTSHGTADIGARMKTRAAVEKDYSKTSHARRSDVAGHRHHES